MMWLRRIVVAIAVSILPLASLAVSAPASTTSASAVDAKMPAGLQVITKSFAELGAGREPLRLNTWQAGYTLKLPMSPREDLAFVRLTLETANSTALIKSRSELSVRVNGRILAQYALDPVNTMNRRVVDIPVELLKPGYNDVYFNVVQHYTYECEDPGSPELWTELNTMSSTVSMGFRGIRKNLQPRLSQLHLAFDRRGWLPRPLSVVTGTEHVSEAQAAAAALVVQGLGLRLGYRPLDVEVYGAATGAAIRPEPTRFPGLSSAVVKGRDVLLIGRRAELSRYLDTELYGLLGAGPFVGTFSGDNGDSVIVVVSGNTDEELMRAARSLAEPEFKFSDVSMETVVSEGAFKQAFLAPTGSAAPFSAFGFRTSGTRGVKVQPITFEFRAPADYGAKKGDLATVKLHFSYGSGLRPDSSMVVKLNGQFAVSVPLGEQGGSEFQKYELRVPAQYIRPGYNTLIFEPIFLAHKERCEVVRDEGMVLTIYEDSTLELSRATTNPVAPDLARFAQGFWPYENKLRLYLTQRDTQTVAATLNLVASLAQKNRAPFEVELRFTPYEAGNMLVVGPLGSAKDSVEKALPLQRYTWSAEGAQAGLLQGVESGRVVTAFTAAQPGVLKAATHVMDSQGMWPSVSGKATIIDTVEKTVVVEPATEQVSFGYASSLSAHFDNWKALLAVAVLLAAVFAYAISRLLKRRANGRKE